MTRRLNLSPLIKHFSGKDKTVANRLSGLTNVKKSTRLSAKQIQKIAQTLIEIGDELDQTDPVLASEADALLQELTKEAQNLSDKKVDQFQKGFNRPSGIMDAAKGVGSWLSDKVDERRKKMMPDGQKMMGEEELGLGDGQQCGSPMMGEEGATLLIMDPDGAEHDHESGCGEPLMEKTDEPMIEVDPEIEDISEPEPEYDLVGLEDIEDRLSNMKFRISDKKSREALQEAIEHIQKAMDYDKASKGRKNKVHEIFDGAGLSLRLKDFE